MPDIKQVFTFIELDPANPWTDASFNFPRLEPVPDDYEEKVGVVAVVSDEGVMSEFNADLLDGRHASAFAKSIHTHAWADVSKLGSKFLDLSDVFEVDYLGHSGQFVRVKAGEDGLEFVAAAGGGAEVFLDLLDTPSSYSGHGGQFVKVKADESGLEFISPGSGVDEFTELIDCPGTYAGHASQFVKVNPTENGLTFGMTTGYDDPVELITDLTLDGEGHVLSEIKYTLHFTGGLLMYIT